MSPVATPVNSEPPGLSDGFKRDATKFAAEEDELSATNGASLRSLWKLSNGTWSELRSYSRRKALYMAIVDGSPGDVRMASIELGRLAFQKKPSKMNSLSAPIGVKREARPTGAR